MKRRLFKLALFLVLGAIVNVAVAWLVSYSALRSGQYWVNHTPRDEIERIWLIYALPDWPDLQSGSKAWELQVGDTWEKLIYASEWNRFGLRRLQCWVNEVKKTRFDNWIVCEVQAGWPAHCLKGGVRYSEQPFIVTENVDAFLLPESKKILAKIDPMLGPFPTGRIFVYRPIWWGLITNSLFYMMLLYGIARGWRYIRSCIRQERGRCPNCGYNLCGNSPRAQYLLKRGCPECGWGREK